MYTLRDEANRKLIYDSTYCLGIFLVCWFWGRDKQQQRNSLDSHKTSSLGRFCTTLLYFPRVYLLTLSHRLSSPTFMADTCAYESSSRFFLFTCAMSESGVHVYIARASDIRTHGGKNGRRGTIEQRRKNSEGEIEEKTV